MSETLSEALVEVAEENGMNIESKTFGDMCSKVKGMERKIERIADCEHEKVDMRLPPSIVKESASEFLFDKCEAGKVRGVEGTKNVLIGECIDCGKKIDISINLEVHRE
jgi:hypothetical protein